MLCKRNHVIFYQLDCITNWNDKDVNKILVSGKEPYKKAHLKTGYNDNDDTRPSCITLSRMIGYAKYFNSNKTMSIGKRLLKKVYQDMVKD